MTAPAFTPGIYGCSCVDGCGRCGGTGIVVYLFGNGDPRDATVERWLTENSAPGYAPGIVMMGEETT